MKNKIVKKVKESYVVVGYTPWSKDIFARKLSKFPGHWHLFSKQEQLTEKNLARIKPKYVFFLHWSWKVPEDIIKKYECVCFHMTDVPYGRGGSPLQNMILRGHKKTKVSALRMTEFFDAGPVYLKKSMVLSGRAEDIYKRASEISAGLILKLIKNSIIPKPQNGVPVIFKRLKPADSEISDCSDVRKIYDKIRMLDATGYPKAVVKCGNFVVEFTNPVLKSGALTCKIVFKKIND